jgi:hypothetical protein
MKEAKFSSRTTRATNEKKNGPEPTGGEDGMLTKANQVPSRSSSSLQQGENVIFDRFSFCLMIPVIVLLLLGLVSPVSAIKPVTVPAPTEPFQLPFSPCITFEVQLARSPSITRR